MSSFCTHCLITMSSVNSGSIVGTIVSDITVRNPSDSLQVTQFRCAPLDAREEDSAIPLTAYNGVGQNILQRYNKGDTVAVSYRLRYNTWQTPEGEPRGRMEIVATATTTVRLGQISTAKRAAETAGIQEDTQPVKVVHAEVVEPTLAEVPF